MTEQNAQNLDYYEDVIDIRKLVKTVLNYKWIIIGVTMIAALASFLISAYVLSPKYEANAYVTITELIISAELESSIQVSPALPETGALAELAEADSIIDQVAVFLNLADYLEENKPDMEAFLQGKSQLHLQVTATNPEIAAQIANGWAQVLVLHLNDLYGTGSSTVVVLESEVQKARDNWNFAQEGLEAYLPQSQVEILEVQLAEQKNSLTRYLNQIELNRILISDGEVLKSQFAVMDKDLKLSTGSALSVIALQQRAAGGISGTQFQFQADEILGQGYLVEDGKSDLERLIGALKTQNEEFTAELTIIEESIGELSAALESERHKVELLTQERDLARSAYTALANQLEETRITQSQEEHSAKIGAEAMIPRESSDPNVILNTGLAAILGGMLGVSIVIIYTWWIEDEEGV